MLPQPTSTVAIIQRLLQLLLLCLTVFFLLKAIPTPTIAQSSEKRELENTVPKHLPLKVKLKQEKEQAFKELNNQKWARDFALEVTNTADKPIYFLSMQLVLPEGIKSLDGYPMGFSLRYGRIELIDLGAPLLPDDVPILPGQSHVLKIPEKTARAWEAYAAEQNYSPNELKKIELRFYVLNFGDGTGFITKLGIPKPSKKQSSTVPCEDQGRQRAQAAVNAAPSSPPDSFSQFPPFSYYQVLNTICFPHFIGVDRPDERGV